MKRTSLIFAVAILGMAVAVAQSQVKKSTVGEITNFAQVETTVTDKAAATGATGHLDSCVAARASPSLHTWQGRSLYPTAIT